MVDPLALVEPPQRLREQRKIAEAHERLRPILAEPLPSPGGDENGPDAHFAAAVVFFAAVAAGFFAVALLAPRS